VEDGWHINTNPARPEFLIPTTVAVKAKHGTKADKVDYPKGADLAVDGYDQPLSVYEGRVVLFGTLNVPKEAARQTEELTVEVKFQACNDRQCLSPKTAKLVGKVPVAAPGETVKAVNEKVFEKDERKKR
ncbi:MAG TPA: protein-disulfide reductase DsbD domain-containing protein, partial [Planctomycetaceae bacterium]